MALIKCPECGREISDKAIACPNCGCPISSDEIQRRKNHLIKKMAAKHYVPCIKCGEWNEVGSTYCAKCGRIINFEDYNALNDVLKEIDENETSSVELAHKKHYDAMVKCPKCKSTSIVYVDKKLSIGRALVGNFIAGGTGAILGGLSSKKGKVKCLKCGYTWKI